MAAQLNGASSGSGLVKYVFIGLAAALSGTFLKWVQGVGESNVFITSLAYLLFTLLPAVLTYIFLARDQEKKLNEVVNSLDSAKNQLSELRRVFEIEKNYYANERLLNVERRVIEETGSSMQEVAELVSAFGDNDVAHVKLKERFRLHAKSIITFDRAFQFEVEQNFKNISHVENEHAQIPHDKRDEIIYESGKDRTEKLSQRYQLGTVLEGIKTLTDRSAEIKRLAAMTHEGVIKALESDDNSKGGV
ncbi:hypothetical protein J5226_19550 [Lysobacter sp. K5869]|uniref:hypothetical protein n=1 Tax=Lysobacter sp. K5869 TaxID=2820808 RepID=UPI001C06311F|nr:hypothetical protein [Lysobacter sp. K5869]QWP75783.1 hypothetical protein J5226_19550 [Lysobacter sp. K5869]